MPDLLVEILSVGNEVYDKSTKLNLYEKFAVKEYWLVNPETNECTGFTLVNNQYQLLGKFTSTLVSKMLGGEIQF